METILIVDDEKNYLLVLEDLLLEEGYQVLTADSAQKGLEIAEEHEVDAVITDMKMPGMDGIALFESIHVRKPDVPVIMMTAYGTQEKALDAMKKGAFDYIFKPFENEQFKFTVRKAVDHHRLVQQNRYLTKELHGRYQFSNIIGKSAAMERIFQLIEKVAPSKATVLITGESGTGKELIARAIHFNSTRQDLPFISVNCGALPENLLESELFGHEKGAFSGALNQRKGRFEMAHEGTLFLDEISEMSPPLQVKLLRVLQEMEFERVGSSQTMKVDVRVVAASNRNLKHEVAAGRFRSDLFYRLNVVHIQIPALRERTDDIPPLVNHFLSKYGRESGRGPLTMHPEAMRRLLDYHWPGNIRELENVIERAVILCTGEQILVSDLPSEVREPGQTVRPVSSEGAQTPPGRDRLPELDPGERLPQWGLKPRQLRAFDFLKNHGFITNKYYSQLNDISERQALRELNEMVDFGLLTRIGKGRACRYVLGEEYSDLPLS
ncbi:sigma-54-dependent transcriptional regulator [Desulfoferrobacter suflitae]|uniref:sigma-54-dependent transcriptional regulator n=1 Tax=Desulfoferrobacter suflitae TaxID=2865782 RepID=UPI00216486C8|nr:sigma-54 dependent transcriptional regulator [Desulfoferrobacter suflitae]MCK8602331.1 sigma-54 dependent transcriptional regulator [Desulfoferrobacter suflitae]